MRRILALLLTFVLLVSAYASAAPVRPCCADEDCGFVQCVEMGCLPAAAPAVAQHATPMPAWKTVRDLPEVARVVLPMQYRQIWTPPD